MQNSEPSLSMFTGDIPIPRDSYGRGLDANEWGSLEPILERVTELLHEGLTEEVVLQAFFNRVSSHSGCTRRGVTPDQLILHVSQTKNNPMERLTLR
jgi:hypothetical protein